MHELHLRSSYLRRSRYHGTSRFLQFYLGPRKMSSLLLPYGVVTEFDGLQLHLSRNSPTGYTGVTKEGSGFRARRGRQQIGVYETAVEAAVAYARERRRERGCERVEEVAAAAEEDDESDDVDALRRRVLGEVDPELKENAVHEQAAKWSVKQ